MKMKSKVASIENVKKFFSGSSGDEITLEEAFESWGRPTENVEQNRGWMSNLLTHLKYHNLVNPIYDTKSGYRKLGGLQLTLEGKRAIGRFEKDNGTVTNGHAKISIEDIMKAVPKLRKENPEFRIRFVVEPKEEG